MSLQEKILEAGIENCLFLVSMSPLQKILGISFKSSNDTPIIVPARISEKRYKVSEGYKITLVSDYEAFGEETFYLMDLDRLIARGNLEFFVKNVT